MKVKSRCLFFKSNLPSTDDKETLHSMSYCSIYICYNLVAAPAKLTQFLSKKYPVHSQLARRMRRGGGRPLLISFSLCTVWSVYFTTCVLSDLRALWPFYRLTRVSLSFSTVWTTVWPWCCLFCVISELCTIWPAFFLTGVLWLLPDQSSCNGLWKA